MSRRSCFAAESSCSSLTAGGVELCDEELPKTLEPRPEVIDDKPQPEVTMVNRPQAHKHAVARTALVAACLIAPRPDPSLASSLPQAPNPLGRQRRLPVLFVAKPSTPNEPRPSALRRKTFGVDRESNVRRPPTRAPFPAAPHRFPCGPARLLRRRRPRHPDRRAGARASSEPPSMCAMRSFTTDSSSILRPKAPSLWRNWTRSQIPMQPVIFSAHGVPKSVPAAAKQRNMFYLDATCPLVSKVHVEASATTPRACEIVLIGHAGHPEVVGTMGQLPEGAVTPDRDGCRRRRVDAPRSDARLRHPDHAVGRRHRRNRRHPEAAASRTSSARTRKTSATRRPTGRRPSRPSRPKIECLLVVGAPTAPTRCASSRSPSAPAARRRCWSSARATFPGPRSRRRRARRHGRRLGSRDAGRRDHRRVARALRRHGRDGHHRATSASPSTCRASCATAAPVS